MCLSACKPLDIENVKASLGFTIFLVLTGEESLLESPKRTWANAYLKLDDNDSTIQCFKELGEGSIQSELINDELPIKVKALEHFVCRVYSSTGPTTLPSLRWELFRSKNLEGEMLPPTRAALLPHIIPANYVTLQDKSYLTDCPELPPIE